MSNSGIQSCIEKLTELIHKTKSDMAIDSHSLELSLEVLGDEKNQLRRLFIKKRNLEEEIIGLKSNIDSLLDSIAARRQHNALMKAVAFDDLIKLTELEHKLRRLNGDEEETTYTDRQGNIVNIEYRAQQ